MGIARGSARRSSSSGPGTVQSQDLAVDEGIPPRFLEQILLELKKAGILISKRGVGGGYQLARDPSDISLGEIVRIFDGAFLPIPCADGKTGSCGCAATGVCGLGQSFGKLREIVEEHLNSQTVAEILQKEQSGDTLSFEI